MSRYDWEPPPLSSDPAKLREYLEREFQRIGLALDALYDGEMETQRTAPFRPRYGTIVVAEPGGWNPGSGPGVYSYEGTTTASATWTKL